MAVTSSNPQLSLVTHIRTTYGHTSCGPYKPTLPWQEYALTWNGTAALENDPQAVMASMKEPIWVCPKGCTV